MKVSAGTWLGPYEIVSRLGSGGMGEVWRARDSRLDRSVAIKVLPSELAADEQFRVRFEREAKAISQLNHPQICALYDVGRADSVEYLVMELLEGETLADRISRGALPVREVLRYGVQIAEGLALAHRHTIVHRDLKPGNIMLTKGGAKLLDFGLAKAFSRVAAEHDVTAITAREPLTEQGMVLGTLQYMAPEQLAGADVDARTDIHALGTVLYEMATGRRAFDGENRLSVVAKVINEMPPHASSIDAAIPPALEHVIERCLEKGPDDRWQSASDVAEELKWVSQSGTQRTAALPVARRRTTALRWIAVLVVAAIAIVLAGFAAARWRPRSGEYAFVLPSVSDAYDSAELAVISPDGRSVVFAARDSVTRIRKLWLRRLDSFEVTPLAGTDDGHEPEWSGDGMSIIYFVNDRLMRVTPGAGAPQKIVSVADPLGTTMNAAGVLLYSAGEAGLHSVTAAGASAVVTSVDREQQHAAHVYPIFLPDGKHFLFVALVRDGVHADRLHRLCTGALGSTQTRCFADISSRVAYVEPGFLLTVRGGGLVALPFDAKKIEITGDAIPLVDDVQFSLNTATAEFSASKEGTITCQRFDSRFELRWVSADGRVGERIGRPSTFATTSALDFAADGRTLMVTLVDPESGLWDLWARDVEAGTEKRLTYDAGGQEVTGIWSRDDSRIFFATARSGWPDVYEHVIDDAGPDRLIAGGPDGQFPDDVSPDGRYFVYSDYSDPATGGDLYALRLDDPKLPSAPFVKTRAREADGMSMFSPDGRWLTYRSNETGVPEVYVKRFPEPGPARQVSNGGSFRSGLWSADGRRIFFMRGREVYAAGFDPASGKVEPARLLFTLPYDSNGMALARDGRFVMLLATRASDGAATRVIAHSRALTAR